MSELVLVERHDTHVVLTLNRPDKRNAVNIELADEIIRTLGTLEDVPVIVVTGAGPAFCAGVDLKERVRTWSTSLGAHRGQYWVDEIGRASCGEREWKYVSVPVVAG